MKIKMEIPEVGLQSGTDELARAEEERTSDPQTFGQIVIFPDGETMVVGND